MSQSYAQYIKGRSKFDGPAQLCSTAGCNEPATHSVRVYEDINLQSVMFPVCSFHYDQWEKETVSSLLVQGLLRDKVVFLDEQERSHFNDSRK